MRELTYEIGIRPLTRCQDGWQCFVPDIPGLSTEGKDEIEAFERMMDVLSETICQRLAQGVKIPEPQPIGAHFGEYGIIFWQFVRVRLGPRPAGVGLLELAIPELEALLEQSDEPICYE